MQFFFFLIKFNNWEIGDLNLKKHLNIYIYIHILIKLHVCFKMNLPPAFELSII